MPLFSPTERAKPLLGTVVRIRVNGLAAPHQAIDAAFSEIAQIHALMSFHEEDSDITRLNREGHCKAIRIDPRTYEVLRCACAIAAVTEGAFDVTIAPQLVSRGILPRPRLACEPDQTSNWRDIELLPEFEIRFRKTLWIDLGGIAKGYAVDRAIKVLSTFSPDSACVNAGGDLRVVGHRLERVRLGSDTFDAESVPVIGLRDGSLASSRGEMNRRRDSHSGPLIDLRNNNSHRPMQFVSVAAPRCVDADALTKVVMARGVCAAKALRKFGAQAIIHDAQFGWREIGGHA